MSENDGGPAHPVTHELSYRHGMSLRDWFAGHIDLNGVEFPSVEAAAVFVGMDTPDTRDILGLFVLGAKANAKLRYLYADAMLAERAK